MEQLENFFWRGIVLSKYSDQNYRIVLSTFLFSVFHFAFLLLPLSYHGGFVNLVGGAAFMGFIWVFVSKYTHNISFAKQSHILVNFFAFIGLFIDNGIF